MVRIAPHHARDPYRPLCAWPEDAVVQWGGSGVVFTAGGGSYATAFFEAFPKQGAVGFIRGEGDTVEAAEEDAFAQWQRASACDHIWGRRGYTNSGGRCLRCGQFSSGRFKPIHPLGEWRRPLSAEDLSSIANGQVAPRPGEKQALWQRQLGWRARQAGVVLPELPLDGRDRRYQEGCWQACLLCYAARWRELRAASPAARRGLAALFDGIGISALHHAALRYGLIEEGELAEALSVEHDDEAAIAPRVSWFNLGACGLRESARRVRQARRIAEKRRQAAAASQTHEQEGPVSP